MGTWHKEAHDQLGGDQEVGKGTEVLSEWVYSQE